MNHSLIIKFINITKTHKGAIFYNSLLYVRLIFNLLITNNKIILAIYYNYVKLSLLLTIKEIKK